MESAVHLLTILISAWVFGHLAETIKLPAAVGQVMAGVVIALLSGALPLTIPLLHGIAESPVIAGVGEAGIIMLLLYAGIEMSPDEVARHRVEAFAVAFGGVVLPSALGFVLAWYFLPEGEARTTQAFVVGVSLSITSIAVAAKVFMDFKLLHHAIGQVTIAAAVIDDVIGLVLLGIATQLITTGVTPDLQSLALLLGKVFLFFVATWAIGHHLSRYLWTALGKVHMPGLRLMALLAIALCYGLLAEALGLHFILGPFMAGLYFEPTRVGKAAYASIDHTVKIVTKGVLGPVFFASIGLTVDLTALIEVPLFVGLLLMAGIVGKLVGCGLPAYLINGHKPSDAMAIGIGMSGRGGVDLFIVAVAFKAGLFSQGNGSHILLSNLYSALVLVSILATALTPLMLRLSLHYHRSLTLSKS